MKPYILVVVICCSCLPAFAQQNNNNKDLQKWLQELKSLVLHVDSTRQIAIREYTQLDSLNNILAQLNFELESIAAGKKKNAKQETDSLNRKKVKLNDQLDIKKQEFDSVLTHLDSCTGRLNDLNKWIEQAKRIDQ